MALPDKNEHYNDKTYWDKRYTTEESYDWFAKYSAFRCQILTTVKKEDRILMLGTKTSFAFNLIVTIFNNAIYRSYVEYHGSVVDNHAT